MAEPFNPTHAVRFEIARGRVSVDGTEARVLVPAAALGKLCASAGPEGVRDFGRNLGTEIGRRVAARLDGGAPSVNALVEHLGGDLALAGLGSLTVEIWGRALVIAVTDSPLESDGDLLLASVLEGALQRAMARDTSLVELERADGRVRFAVLSPKTADGVRKWLGEGVSWGDALARLNAAK
jgi:hypothetical protein